MDIVIRAGRRGEGKSRRGGGGPGKMRWVVYFFFENWVIRPRREGELRGVEGVWEEKGRGLTGVGDKEMF